VRQLPRSLDVVAREAGAKSRDDAGHSLWREAVMNLGTFLGGAAGKYGSEPTTAYRKRK